MKKIKSLNKFWNRHPFFYKVRFYLLLNDVEMADLETINYNKINPVHSIPKLFFDCNKEIFENEKENLSDFEKVKKIAGWLRLNIKGGKGLGFDSEKTLQYMLNGGYGVCSDFSQIFNNFCVINNILVREWGLNNNQFNETGHSFNEIFSREFNKWILIDTSNSIYFTEEKDAISIPLSVVEVFSKSRLNQSKKTNILTEMTNFDNNKIEHYYYSKNIQPFLVDNYKNSVFDWLLIHLKFLPLSIIHGISIVLKMNYNFKKIKLPAVT